MNGGKTPALGPLGPQTRAGLASENVTRGINTIRQSPPNTVAVKAGGQPSEGVSQVPPLPNMQDLQKRKVSVLRPIDKSPMVAGVNSNRQPPSRRASGGQLAADPLFSSSKGAGLETMPNIRASAAGAPTGDVDHGIGSRKEIISASPSPKSGVVRGPSLRNVNALADKSGTSGSPPTPNGRRLSHNKLTGDTAIFASASQAVQASPKSSGNRIGLDRRESRNFRLPTSPSSFAQSSPSVRNSGRMSGHNQISHSPQLNGISTVHVISTKEFAQAVRRSSSLDPHLQLPRLLPSDRTSSSDMQQPLNPLVTFQSPYEKGSLAQTQQEEKHESSFPLPGQSMQSNSPNHSVTAMSAAQTSAPGEENISTSDSQKSSEQGHSHPSLELPPPTASPSVNPLDATDTHSHDLGSNNRNSGPPHASGSNVTRLPSLPNNNSNAVSPVHNRTALFSGSDQDIINARSTASPSLVFSTNLSPERHVQEIRLIQMNSLSPDDPNAQHNSIP